MKRNETKQNKIPSSYFHIFLLLSDKGKDLENSDMWAVIIIVFIFSPLLLWENH